MRSLLLLILVLFTTGMTAQETSDIFKSDGVVFSGDRSILRENKQIIEFSGNVYFTSDIVEIEQAEKIVYDKKTKTFTVSGFSELLINGKRRLASDLGPTTLKMELGENTVYLVANLKTCPGGKGKSC